MGKRLILFQDALFSLVEEKHVSLQKNHLLEAAAFSLLFPVRVELVFERYISWNVGFSRV
jgi:hypothetical protein